MSRSSSDTMRPSRVCRSSSLMILIVQMARALPPSVSAVNDAPPLASVSKSWKVSSFSKFASSTTSTVTSLRVTPGPKVSTPSVWMKSAPFLALFSLVAKLHPTVPAVPPTRTTVHVTLPALSLTGRYSLSNLRLPGVSLSSMVTVHSLVSPTITWPLSGASSSTVKVSFSSCSSSSRMGTLIEAKLWPGKKVRSPDTSV